MEYRRPAATADPLGTAATPTWTETQRAAARNSGLFILGQALRLGQMDLTVALTPPEEEPE